MKRIVRYIMIAGLMAVLSAPVTDAREGRQGRGNGNGNRTEQSGNSGHNTPGRRGGNNGGNRPGNHGGNRPGNNSGNRPGNHGGYKPGNHDGYRPGGNHGGYKPGNHDGYRPGGNHGGYKPGNHNGYRPGGNHGPVFGGNHHGGYRPAPPPPPRHDHWPRYHRPTPPPHYACGPHGPSFGSILGMVLGTAYNISLNYLYNNGYTVAGYGNNAIYINNVPQMNYNWPNAVLYYNNGMLSSSQYIYSTTWHDTSRYYRLYNSFCNQYGYPASVSNTGMVMSASWFGFDGRFVTIQYSPGYTDSGMACYYTTLSFGN